MGSRVYLHHSELSLLDLPLSLSFHQRAHRAAHVINPLHNADLRRSASYSCASYGGMADGILPHHLVDDRRFHDCSLIAHLRRHSGATPLLLLLARHVAAAPQLRIGLTTRLLILAEDHICLTPRIPHLTLESRAALTEADTRDLPYPIGELLGNCLRHQRSKLVAASSEQHIVGNIQLHRYLPQRRAEMPDSLITCGVTVVIVDRLELCSVEHDPGLGWVCVASMHPTVEGELVP